MTEPTTFSILVVDDEESIRSLLRKSLANLPVTIDEAQTGTDALAMLEEKSYNLLITDQVMPGVTGEALIHWVEQHSPKTMTILITGFPSIEQAVDAINHGVHDIILKPFSGAYVKRTVQKIIEHHRLIEAETEHGRELVVANQALQRSDQEKDTLIATMLANVLGPASALLTNAEVLSSGIFGSLNEEQAKIVANLTQHARKIFHWVNWVEKVSLLTREENIQQQEDVDLAAICAEICREIQADTQGADLTLALAANEGENFIKANPELLFYAIYHLLQAIISVAEPRTTVALGIRKEEPHGLALDMSFSPQEEEGKVLFSLFHGQAAGSAEAPLFQYSWLTYAKKIMQLHNGSLSLDAQPAYRLALHFERC